MRTEVPNSDPQAHGGVFATTHWSVVLAAGQNDTPQSGAALEQLCRTYWFPLYAYVRRCGHSPENAEDLTQGFFAHLLARGSLSAVQPGHGRFRCFMLVALKRFLSNQQERATAAKRGGAKVHVPFDGREAEERYALEAGQWITRDTLFDRAWGLSVMKAASQQLEEEYRLEGKENLFRHIKMFAGSGESEATYAEAGAQMGMNAGAVKVSVFRMRRRYRELLREAVAQTLSSTADVEDELRSLKETFYER